ncbi:copper resistance protein CopC [Microbacterium oxydans]|nr:copper resistance protein CopC [Microbacterium oxydans]
MHKRLSARTTAVLTTLLLSASVVLGTASPAAAHDDFVSSYPTADSTINGSPDEISLMFNGTLTGGDDATVVEVIDDSGANVAVDPPTVSGDSITQHLSPRRRNRHLHRPLEDRLRRRTPDQRRVCVHRHARDGHGTQHCDHKPHP